MFYMDVFFTTKEVAAMLRVTDRTICRMIEKGILKAVKVGVGTGHRSVWRIYQKEIDRFIAEEYEKRSR